MVYVIKTYLAKPLGWLGHKVGLSADATAGILAATANFQPTLILPVMLGKLVAGFLSVWLASKFVIPQVLYATKKQIS